MNKLKKVLVFSDKPAQAAELCYGAAQLGEEVLAAVSGDRSAAEKISKYGAGRVFWLGAEQPGAIMEATVPLLADLIRKEQPERAML
ncbi:MAG: hypothetical protein LBS10_06240 [Gracilibacteraceae bacterium]|jgi:electron transfer flavoprotein alpha subunit|nr:hypothetical protein [Gracilibacteraceae bacterium]